MASKKTLDRIVSAYEKSTKKKTDSNDTDIQNMFNDFGITFETNDFYCVSSGTGVRCQAKVSKNDFDKIIDSHLVYIVDYIKSKLSDTSILKEL